MSVFNSSAKCPILELNRRLQFSLLMSASVGYYDASKYKQRHWNICFTAYVDNVNELTVMTDLLYILINLRESSL